MLRAITSVILASISLVTAYPRLGWWPLAWVAFVPLYFALHNRSWRASFGLSYLYGFVFFTLTLGWFVYVTYPGALLLIAYLSLYFALFGLAVKFVQPLPVLTRIFIYPCIWVLLEYARAFVITGFNWAMLGHSQYQNLLLIQISDVTGAFGVSYLVMLANALIFETIQVARAKGDQQEAVKQIRTAQILTFVLFAAVLGYGVWQLKHVRIDGYVKVGVVQPNIPQDLKWDPLLQPWIVQKTIGLTSALAQQNLDLIIWPETSLPGVISEVPQLMNRIQSAARDVKTPLLIGAISDKGKQYFNSAYLLDRSGLIVGRYDKIHLVPFGEYIPLRPILGWINQYVGLEDFTSGREYTLLNAGPAQVPFAVLICFEDTVGYLRRNFINAGAQFFVNMTNDAWFKDTKAPFLHMVSALFISVEHKRALVRSANTGFSGFIDPWGRIIHFAQDASGKATFVHASAAAVVPAVSSRTFYTKYADVFTLVCLFAILWAVIMVRRRTKHKQG